MPNLNNSERYIGPEVYKFTNIGPSVSWGTNRVNPIDDRNSERANTPKCKKECHIILPMVFQ